MRRHVLALPAALLLSVLVAGTAFATHCGNASKQSGAGQHVVILVDPVTETITPIAGFNAAGRFTGAYADVWIDVDLSGTPTAADCVINDTYLVSMHAGRVAPGQDGGDDLAVIPNVLRGEDPGGPENGVGFAELSASCFAG
jgi:hypothetical protein